jgi:hypothetical protein
VTCPGCRRDNHPARRYCGACGCNFEPACRDCGFANEHVDRFCGGCGEALRAGEHRDRPGFAGAAAGAAVYAAVTGVAAAPGAGSSWDSTELAALFAPAPAAVDNPELPDAGISQSDVDRLFGAAP